MTNCLPCLALLACCIQFDGGSSRPMVVVSGRLERPALSMGNLVSAESVRIVPIDGGLAFRQGNTDILRYQWLPRSRGGEYERANYYHPLRDLNGDVITEDFPADHLHHRGIYWAWHQVVVGDRAAGDSWLAEDFDWRIASSSVAHHGRRAGQRLAGSATLTNEVRWHSPDIRNEEGETVPFVRERSSVTVFPASQRTRALDFEIELWALVDDVSIGGSQDDKGYGGFSARIKLPKNVQFRGADGIVEPKRTAIKAGRWVNIVGTFGDSDEPSAVAIFVHPQSRGFPQPWILRSQGSMQNPVYPGREVVPLSRNRPTRLFYRLLLQREPLSAAQLNEAYKDYANSAPIADRGN